MQRQIPRSVSILGIMAAILIGLWVLGKLAPDSSASAEDRELRADLAKMQMPDIQGPDVVTGQNFHLADYKGKVVLVNFWATWCGPCRMEIPDLIELQKKYGPKGFTIVGLSQDDKPDPAKKFAQDQKLNYPVIMEPEGTARALGIQGLPTSFLVDRNGKIVYAMEGVDPNRAPKDVWGAEIEKVL